MRRPFGTLWPLAQEPTEPEPETTDSQGWSMLFPRMKIHTLRLLSSLCTYKNENGRKFS